MTFFTAEWYGLIEKLLDRLGGKLRVVQPVEEREGLAKLALDRIFHEDTEKDLPRFQSQEQYESFLKAFFSYDILEEFLEDSLVEDIMINDTRDIFVHRTGEGLVRTGRRYESATALNLLVRKIFIFGGRRSTRPIADLELFDVRGRANVVTSPWGPQITITRAKKNPLTILDLIRLDMLSPELAAQLWIYVEGYGIRPANLLIAGGAGGGKTTLLNALLSFLPRADRLVTIEDTLELNTDGLSNCSRLESSADISLAALVKNSLRMRPDRVLVGEVRGEEARDMMTAMNLGKYCMGTLHANSARETVVRLQNEPMNIPPILVSLVDVIIVLKRVDIDGQRTRTVAEVVETSGMERDVVLLAPVWAYDHKEKKVSELSPSSSFRDRLTRESAVSSKTILDETNRRARFISMVLESRRFKDLRSVTEIFQQYVENPQQAYGDMQVMVKRLPSGGADEPVVLD